MMPSKYKISPANDGWFVMMNANGRIMTESYATETEAMRAREEFEHGTRQAASKPDVWVIADAWVVEPCLGGTQLGEVSQLDLTQYNVLKRLTQEDLDSMMEEFFQREGHYPE